VQWGWAHAHTHVRTRTAFIFRFAWLAADGMAPVISLHQNLYVCQSWHQYKSFKYTLWLLRHKLCLWPCDPIPSWLELVVLLHLFSFYNITNSQLIFLHLKIFIIICHQTLPHDFPICNVFLSLYNTKGNV